MVTQFKNRYSVVSNTLAGGVQILSFIIGSFRMIILLFLFFLNKRNLAFENLAFVNLDFVNLAFVNLAFVNLAFANLALANLAFAIF